MHMSHIARVLQFEDNLLFIPKHFTKILNKK